MAITDAACSASACARDFNAATMLLLGASLLSVLRYVLP